MKKFTILILMIVLSSWQVFAQKSTSQVFHSSKPVKSVLTDFTEFSDDFESGIGSWTTTNSWGLTTTKSHSPTHSISESPTGNYTNNQTSSCTMTNGVDLTSRLSAQVSFWGQYQIEDGFDYMYVDVSNDNFATFTNLGFFTGVSTTWTQYTYSLGGFVGTGNNNVKVRFRFISDQGFVMDGMYIDDFIITSSDEDHSPPLILTTPPEFYEGTLGEFVAEADIIDISGLSLAQCSYSVDGVFQNTVDGVNTSGNHYTFTIPVQSPGSNVDFTIAATDASVYANTTVMPVASYIAGEYIKYDNGQVDYFVQFLATQGAAVAFSLNGPTHLATALIRNYTDVDHLNAQERFHIWSSGSSGPGTDLVPPFLVTPEATLSNTSPMTRIDLRPYMAQIGDLTTDIYMGFTVDVDTVNITETNPGTAGRSFAYNGAAWAADATVDYHMRLITTGSELGVPDADENKVSVYPNPMHQYSFAQFSKNVLNPRAELFTMLGQNIPVRQVVEGNRIQLLRGNLTPGIYILKLYDSNRMIHLQKLIIH